MITGNKGKKLPIILSLVVMLFFLGILSYGTLYRSGSNIPEVENGVLDLTSWDIKKDGSAALNGEWEFYWNRLFLQEDLDRTEAAWGKMLVKVPGTWDKYRSGNESLPGLGYATYRVSVRQGGNRLDGLKVMTTLTASKLFINGKEYMSSGIVGTDAKSEIPAKTPALIRIDDNSDVLDIVFHVSNFTDARGGIWEELRIGDYEQLEMADRRQLVRDAAMIVYLLVISVYYMSMYLLRRDSKESLYFSIGCTLIMAKLLVSDSYFIYRLFPHFSYRLSVFLFYISLYWGVFMFMVFINSLYPDTTSKKVLRVYFIAACMFTVFHMVLPIRVSSSITFVFDLINLTGLAYILFIIIRAAYIGLPGARIIIWGTFVMVLAIVHDIMKFSNIITSPFDALTAAGMVIFILLLSIVFTARSVQEYKQLQALTDKLESANKLKDEFLANTSHELRTPVNAMIAITESIVKDEKSTLGQNEKGDLLHVISSGRRLVSLINDLLDYSRLKHGDLNLARKDFFMDNLLKGVVREFSFIAAGKNIDISYQRNEKLPSVNADEYRITQVLYNIIGNAVKFTASGGKITISTFSDQDTVYVSVADTGIGIPEEKLGDVFETFRQADASITRKYGGMGLGLSISREIINAHGREIQVKSRPGEGSEFIFGVPAEKTDIHPEAKLPESSYAERKSSLMEQSSELAAAGTKKGIIAIVDDNYANLIGAINILRADDYTVKGFTDPRAALREISDDAGTAVAVIDVMMPELSGYDVCRKIRERFSLFELPVLMLTANTALESMLEGFDSGANDFLKKPFDGEELRARVRTLYNLKYATEKAINNETAFLQAQIKPHFLYNTINTIIASCYKDAGQAAAMLLDLSDYLRHLFDFESEERLIPLDREIEAVKAYLSLEKARFAGNLEYELELADYNNTLIPPMIIQPIVENAVRHGLRKVERKGSIIIKGVWDGDYYALVIEDNGAGIAVGDLEKILRGEKKEGTGTGFANVRKRLKYFYGTDIELESSAGADTRVTMRVKRGDKGDAQDRTD